MIGCLSILSLNPILFAAITSLASSCYNCSQHSSKGDILKLLDGNNATCVQRMFGDLQPISFSFGILNNDNLKTVTVSVTANRCDDPYLMLTAQGSCNSEAPMQCQLMTGVSQTSTHKICNFSCQCITACNCIIAWTQPFEGDIQSICEISIDNL